MDFRKLLIFGLIFFVLYYLFGLTGIFIILSIYFVFFYVYKKKYYVRVISGETGAGKSLMANHIIQKYLRKNKRIKKYNSKCKNNDLMLSEYNIYSTFYIEGAKILPEDFYNYKYPENSILLIDESQIMFDSREHGKLTKLGISNKLKAMLSMHRHHKLDIYFITQNPQEVDAQIRRYCNDLLVIERCIYFRRFYKVAEKFKIKTDNPPILVIYKSWSNVSDYLRWYNCVNVDITARQMGAKTKIAFIRSSDCNTYNTYQNDSFYASLLPIPEKYHYDRDSYINTGTSK